MRCVWMASSLLLALLAEPAHGREATLLHHLEPATFQAMAEARGFSVTQQGARKFLLQKPGSVDVRAKLDQCDEADRCSLLLLRSYHPIGSSPTLRAAAENYDRGVPIAYVALYGQGEATSVGAGRDVWLSPGRTRENIAAEIDFSAKIADALAATLRVADPGLGTAGSKGR